MRARPRVVSVLAWALVAWGLVACGQTHADPLAARAVLDAYKTFHSDYLAVAEAFPVNPDDPRVTAHLTGRELLQVHAQLLTMRNTGQYVQGTIDVAPQVTSIKGVSATVMDCSFDHTVFVDAATNQARTQPASRRTLVTATMEDVGGVWKLADFGAGGSDCTAR
jgi:hypothetical protein